MVFLIGYDGVDGGKTGLFINKRIIITLNWVNGRRAIIN